MEIKNNLCRTTKKCKPDNYGSCSIRRGIYINGLTPDSTFEKRIHKSSKGDEPVREITLHPEHIDDHALWRAFRDGDEKALITMFDRFTKPMFNYGLRSLLTVNW